MPDAVIPTVAVAVAVELGPGLTPAEAVLALRDEPGLVCLWGVWAGGGALIASRPVVRAGPGFDHLRRVPAIASARGLPRVGGGWLGWLGYDLRLALEDVPSRHAPGPLPAAGMAYYDHLLRYDDRTQRWSFEAIVGAGQDEELERRADELAAVLRGPRPVARPYTAGQFAETPAVDHLAAVEQAITRIRAGDLFQVNVCTRLGAVFDGSAVDLFATAVGALRPAYGALVCAPDAALVSLSPELYLRRTGVDVLTQPIKGTRLRPGTVGEEGAEGDEGAELLRRSAKDAAENVMIVDLMRNDLGRVCRPGSVAAGELLTVQAHPGVWHLVSTVGGALAPGTSDAELLTATFPPGSVTGVPKVQAMRTIDAIEGAGRGAYTGAIGFASPVAGLQLSVAIRTFEVAAGRVELGVGGGITVDSVPAEEWREVQVKAAPLLAAAGFAPWRGTLAGVAAFDAPWPLPGGVDELVEEIAVRGGAPVRLADHLARLDRSARELFGAPAPELAGRVLAVAAAGGAGVLRIELGRGGAATVRALPPLGPRRPLSLTSVRRARSIGRHAWAVAPNEDRQLYVADDGCLVGTSLGALFVVRADGSLATAPLRDDVRPGVRRRAVLDAADALGLVVHLETVRLADLAGTAAFVAGSRCGLVVVEAVDGVSLRPVDPALLACLAGPRGNGTL